MIWLPDDALNIAGVNVALSNTYTSMTSAIIEPIDSLSSTTHWYKLGLNTDTTSFPENGMSLSTFSLWLSWEYGNQYFKFTSLSTDGISSTNDVEVELQTGVTNIKIADVKDYRIIPNVKSNIIINNNFKPFDLVYIPGIEAASNKRYAITRCDFMHDGNPIHLSSGVTFGNEHDTKQVVRLVQSLSGNSTSSFAMDMADYANRYSRTMQKPLAIIDSWTGQIQGDYGTVISEGEQIAQFWPLYMLNRKEQLLIDYRDAYYILNTPLSCDERSISLLSSDGDLSSQWKNDIRIWGFHSQADATAYDNSTSFIVRQGGNGLNVPTGNEYVDYINVNSFKDDIIQTVADTISADLSGITGGSGGMFAWTQETRTIGVGGVMIGRQWVTATGTGSGKQDAFYSLKCTISNSGSRSCQVVSNATLGQAPTTTECWIPIYTISGGKITADYRGAFVVPAYD